MVTPPVLAASTTAFISRVFRARVVPIFPPIVVNPAPVTISISLAAVLESSFPVMLTFPPPEVIVRSASATASPVIVKTPLFVRVILPPKVLVSAVRLTSSISVPIA